MSAPTFSDAEVWSGEPTLRPTRPDSRIGWLLVIAAVSLLCIGFLGGIFANPAPVFRCAVQTGEPA